MFVDSIMIIHAQSDLWMSYMCLHVYDTHWSTDGCANTVCLQCYYVAIYKIVEEDVHYVKHSWHSTLRTLTWGSPSPDAMFDGHLHSSCSTATIMTFPLAGVCVVCGPPAIISAFGFTLLAIEGCSCSYLQDNVNCVPTNQYWLDCRWHWRLTSSRLMT
jgi:hypothetical protein